MNSHMHGVEHMHWVDPTSLAHLPPPAGAPLSLPPPDEVVRQSTQWQGQHPGVVGASPWEISDPAPPPALAAWVEARQGPLRRFGARPKVVLVLGAAAIAGVAAVAVV